MDTSPRPQEQLVFHLTGRLAGGLQSVAGTALRPALFARFHDLTRLRYDFPLVLVEATEDEHHVRSLSGIVDALLQRIVPAGIEGERPRRTVLRLEQQIRELMRDGASGSLRELWDQAAALLVTRGGEPVESDLARARAALDIEGRLVECDASLPAALVRHVWHAVQRERAQRARREIETLVVRLSDLVKADHLRSEAGRHADTLEAGVGDSHRDLFDFSVMARLLAKPSGASALSPSRRRRIESVLAVLRAQRFFAAEDGYRFEFAEARDAIAAYRERLPEMAALVKAMTIAELEIQGRYVEARHDALFAGHGPRSLGPRELGLFPDYLVCPSAGRGRRGGGAAARALLFKVLTSGAPVKILVESGSLLEDTLSGEGGFSLGAQLASSVMGLNEVYVLQSAAAGLYRARGRLLGAMRYPGAALISVYAGARPVHGGAAPSPYLLSAAATESRAFPSFCYDPGAGSGWAARFSLAGNPQPEADWPRHEFSWADGAMQGVTETLAFTLADFAVCDPSYAHHFARASDGADTAGMVALAEWLEQPQGRMPETVPYIHAIEPDNRLRRLVVDARLAQAARRCAESWRRLAEIEGLKRERAAAAAPAPVPAAEAPAVPPAAAGATDGAAVLAVEGAATERKPGDPYIETERCSSCNECINLNNAMFAYNENKQAYIANPDAGTFREMVEAAESCQVAVIHPGKPRNPREPGLEELVARAEPFQ